jgi:V8-like Glu-specific endopeptidase
MSALTKRLTGYEARQLRDALLSAFSFGEFEMFVRLALDEPLHNIVNTARPLPQVALDVVDWADRQNKLRRLFEGALREVPGNRDLRQAVGEVLNAEARGEDLEAIVNQNPDAFPDVERWRDRMAESERAVCRVENPEHTPFGTGFLVGQDLVMTCRHVWEQCLGNGSEETLRFAFGYRVLANGREATAARSAPLADANGRWLVADSPVSDLDFVLVRLADRAGKATVGTYTGAPERGWLSPNDYTFQGRETAVIIQHPAGRPMKLAFGVVGQPAERRIAYQIDTLQGSSGAPVFLNDWRPVAIHRQEMDGDHNAGVPFAEILPAVQHLLG